MRIDQLLVRRGLAQTRSQAQRLIAAGVEWGRAGAWQATRKNGDEVPEDAELRLLDTAEARFVSRGGLKLDAALARTGIDVQQTLCLDVGQSTGGFTDCLLQRSAAHVIGLDVGSGQLHARLRGDVRVSGLEQINARHLGDPAVAAPLRDALGRLGHPAAASFDLVVGDLSFISQTLVLPALVPWLRPGGHLLMLVKPQFELQPGQLGSGGIVRDERLYAQVAQRILEAHAAAGLRMVDYFDSAIAGGDGNREFFVHSILPLEPTT